MSAATNGNPLRPFDPKTDGPWTTREATHLLWRTQFGASPDEIATAAEVGLAATLDRLLTPQAELHEFESSQRLLRQIAVDTGSIASLKAWWLYRMLYSRNSLAEKLSLFWHGHFATSEAKVRSVDYMAAQNDLIREHALGSFRDLLLGMTRDVAMLVWLDGNANRKRQPNENFAREVMELFSLGVGNYAEQDIKEAARAFTGWHVRNGEFWFNRSQHDAGIKHVFGSSGNLNGEDVIELCLAQESCPRFLAVKLLRFFVSPHADLELVDALADRIRLHDFAMQPVMRELLGSELFFRQSSRHSIIKSPLDLVLGSQRTLGGSVNLQANVALLRRLGQDIFEPPTVKGWDGGRHWINSASMLQRVNFAAELAGGDRYGAIADPLDRVGLPADAPADVVVGRFVELVLARNLVATTVDRLVDYLGQEAGERSQQSRGLLHLLMAMPEFQLM